MYKRKYVIVKTILWRFISMMITTVLSYVLTGNPTLSVSIGAIDLIVKTVAQCWYENIWVKILLNEVNKDIHPDKRVIH